jgi:hypothetical protein
MPSQAMQDVIDTLRGQQKAAASQPSPTLEQRRAAFAPAGRLHPLPDDVVVTDVTAGGVPAHWLAAPGADTGRVLLFLHDPEFTSPCTSATACPTSTRSWPAPPKPPRPPSRPGTSSGPGSANQTAQVNDMRTIAGSKRPVNVRGVMAPVQESAP